MHRRRYRLLAPNLVTAANIVAGFLAMLAAAEGRYDLSVRLLLLALTLDTLDGVVARWLGATSEFGQELDSFSDALSFGAAPAFLVQRALLGPLGALGVVVSVVYLLAAVIRLTRFVLMSDAHDKERRTVGVPVPIAASYLMAAVLMRDHIGVEDAAVLTLVFAALMVTRMKLPNLKGRNVVTAMLLVGVVNYVVVVFRPSWYSIGWWNVWNVMILIAAHLQSRRLEPESATVE